MKIKKILRGIKNRIIKYKTKITTKPIWIYIKDGPLKDGFILINKNLHDGWSKMENGTYDKFIYDFLSSNNILGSTVWDVGAHFGYHALSFAKLVGSNGRVVTFEPNPYNIERLRMNVEKNTDLINRISIVEQALSSKTGTTTMIISNDVDGSKSTGSHIKEINLKPLDKKKYKGFYEHTVPTITIDDFLTNNKEKDPDIIKIDIEGAEFFALSGAAKLLERKHPILFIEIHDIINMFNVNKLLSNMKYRIELLDVENASTSRCFVVAY
ncbi:MAG: FkbM family methyltransferase [Candidatus Paceibacterota bacterium]|jgi:FkbM family methyltransferase